MTAAHHITCQPSCDWCPDCWCHNDTDHAICAKPGYGRHLPCRHHDTDTEEDL